MRTRPVALLVTFATFVGFVVAAAAGALSSDPREVGRFLDPFDDQRPEEGTEKCLVERCSSLTP